MKKWLGFEKGVDLGGWLSQCDHTKERYENFIKEEDFKEVASWGADHVRVPVDYNPVETNDGDYKEEGFAYIQNAIDWCKKYNLNMILDLHKTFGYSFDSGEKEDGFFENEKYQERFYKLWEEFARRYGKYHDTVAFELLNEVTLPSYCDTWNRVADTCIQRIRKIAPSVTILVGGYWNNAAAAVKDIKLSSYDNIVLNFHCYEPLVFTHQGAHWIDTMPLDFRIKFPGNVNDYVEKMRPIFDDQIEGFLACNDGKEAVEPAYFEKVFDEAIKVAEEKNTSLYCGEFGVINLADTESTLNWYKMILPALKKNNIGFAAWSYKEMDFGLIDDHMKPVIADIKKELFT